jgi:uncharacterized protein with PQ loop repeat
MPGEAGTTPDVDGIESSDGWWDWTGCGRGYGRGKMSPAPNNSTLTPGASELLSWEKSDNNNNSSSSSSSSSDSDSEDDQNSGSWMALMFGWGSAALYLGSRIPQLYKNWRLKSCEGLSIMMFLFSVFGNALYVASILLNSLDRDYLIRNMPWWLGSTGTLFFDFSVSWLCDANLFVCMSVILFVCLFNAVR